MPRSTSRSSLPSTYDDFLYAGVGESSNGAPLTVLSVLARQNLDPWEAAADLNRLPHDTAARRLTSMITASSGRSWTAEQAAIADRVIALLPRRSAAAGGQPTPNESTVQTSVDRPSPTVAMMVIAIYICVMFLMQWLAANRLQVAPAQVAASPTRAATLEGTLPSGPASDQTTKSPQ